MIGIVCFFFCGRGGEGRGGEGRGGEGRGGEGRGGEGRGGEGRGGEGRGGEGRGGEGRGGEGRGGEGRGGEGRGGGVGVRVNATQQALNAKEKTRIQDYKNNHLRISFLNLESSHIQQA